MDATAAAVMEEGSGHEADLVNLRFLPNAVCTTAENAELLERIGPHV